MSPNSRGTFHYPIMLVNVLLNMACGNSLHTTSIHILDNDSLLNIFHLCRPFLLSKGHWQDANMRFGGGRQWVGERWWYRLAHVCQRWRSLILGSASYLGLCLVCTYGTPVVKMLARSPPLPLVIDYEYEDITAKDEKAIILALAQRDRVRRIRLALPVLKLKKLIMAMDGGYPILEYLLLGDLIKGGGMALILPERLQTPRLRHLTIDCPIPLRSSSLGTTANLVILCLPMRHPSTYFEPTALLQWLSLMPQLEKILIVFHFPVSDHDVERQLMRTPIMTHVTLPNLRLFHLKAVSSYSEAVLSRITAPRLETFQILYPNELTSSVPHLLQFMKRTKSLRFYRAKFNFCSDYVVAEVYSRKGETYPFYMEVECLHLDWQVSTVAQIFNALSQTFSTVKHLTVTHQEHSLSSEGHNEVDRSEWRKLLRSFRNVKTLRIEDGLIGEFSRSLRLEDGEHALDLLPELQELTYSASGNTNDAFTSFIDARQSEGRPVTLIES